MMESTSSCAVVPIFSNKKRRVKQALYSNPSTNNTCKTNNLQSSFSINTSARNITGFQADKTEDYKPKTTGKPDFVCRNGSSFGKQSSQGNVMNVSHNPPNNERMQGFKKIGNVMRGFQQRDMQVKDSFPQKGSGRKLPYTRSLPKPIPVGSSSFSKQSLKIDQQLSLNKNSTTSTEFEKVEKIPKNHNVKKENVMKDHPENSPKFLTTSIKNLKDWEDLREKITFIFEVFGTLESAVSTNVSDNAKTFMLKDDTGSMRCTFWEMDRMLPRLIRGKSYRCIGSLDRKSKTFNCVTVRPSTLAEVHSAKISTACTYIVMQAYIATFRED